MSRLYSAIIRRYGKRATRVLGFALLLVLVSVVVVVATEFPLLTQGAVQPVDEAIYRAYNPGYASGSGAFDSFVRVSSANSGIVEGYNTDGRPPQFQENTSPSFTRSYRLSNVPITSDPEFPGVYREFQLDINQTAGHHLSLDEVEVYLTRYPNLLGYPWVPPTAYKVYELDKPEGTSHNIALNYDLAAGSGKRDMILRIPNANFLSVPLGADPLCAFQGLPPAGAECETFVILYSKFGEDNPAYFNDDGYEEWGVQLYNLATKSGVKYEDLNADGDRDAGEPGLAGWKIYVDINGNHTLDLGEPFDVTDATGAYQITGIVGGYTFKVREVGQTDWSCSQPSTGDEYGCFYSEFFAAGANLTGNDFGNWRPATKSGVKFEDLDADGVKDALEPGLAGWRIYVDYDDDGVHDLAEPSAVTVAGGAYTITGINPGTWKVKEVAQAGWTCSFPAGCYHQEVFQSGGTYPGNDFGNWRPATKSGVKFEDLDADGVKETGEPGLPGWTIYVDVNGDGALTSGEPSGLTSGDGAYEIVGIVPGTHKVREVAQPDWTCSFPTTADTFGCYHEELFQSGGSYPDNDFGNWQPATKSGMKFEDRNANGQKDAGDPGVDGVTIKAFNDLGTLVASAVTAGGGLYSFELAPGAYKVCEFPPEADPSWQQSFPNAETPGMADCTGFAGAAAFGWAITLDSGEVHKNNDFGNWRPATKSGVKFEDLNADGVRDALDAGLPDWTIYVDYDSDGVHDPTEPFAITGANGEYLIAGIDPGTWTVKEVDQTGWTCSYPDPCLYDEIFESGGSYPGNDFGNWYPVSRGGIKFIDLDADGSAQEAGEPGLSGITFYIDYDDDDFLDPGEPFDESDSSGAYLITGIMPGDWDLKEVPSGNWKCSFPGPCLEKSDLGSGDVELGNDFGNWEPATKSGTKFEDLDADGAGREAGEPGLPGWTIFVDYDDDGALDAGEPSDTTGADGTYTIENIHPGHWKVKELGQAGWTCSYPTPCFYQETFGSGAALEGNDFGNWHPATKSGTKFEDLDADGAAREAGEPGLEGWTIYVDVDGDGEFDLAEPSDTTDANGAYTITGITPGARTVREVAESGWTCSFPNPCYYSETFTSREVVTGNDFGNWTPPRKSGMKFEDLDADGEPREAGEPGLPGWTIFVDYNGDGTLDPAEPSVVTDVNGEYEITGINPGFWKVREVGQADWTCSFPAASDAFGCYYEEDFISSAALTGNDFGNWHPATKSGMKFEDLDADGAAREAGEPGLPGWAIFVDYNDNAVLDAGEPSDVTDANGEYEITGINPGPWKVKEVGQTGWTCSFPAPCVYEETFTSQAVLEGNDFGNWTTASKSGMKFEDLDADGVKDPTELGLAGWTIFVDYDDDGVRDASEPSDVTGTDGTYTITGINPGTWKVKEVGQTGWTCSFPVPCYYEETFTSRAALIANDFGNWHPATKSGMKFEDLDADGEKDDLETGLEGWTIFVDYDDDGALDAGEPSHVTGADGTYTITGINPGTWKVKEVGQTGWTCSFPVPCYYEETFTSRAALIDNDFGNWHPATKSGMKFEDLDADGVKDPAELGLEGWTIFVDYNDDGVLDAGEPFDVTDAGGEYLITGINPGFWKVREVGQTGWTCSFPVPCYHQETFTSRAALIGNDFGNWYPATKSGTKFEDLDADGVKDEGELGLPDWTIFVDYNDDGVLDAGEPSDLTDAAGEYLITGINPGLWKVKEVGQAGWTCSYPIPCYYEETFTSRATFVDNDFGNWTTASKWGMKFEDLNANGVKDPDEQGLEGWTIFVDVDGDGAFDLDEPSDDTGADGSYTISGIDPGTYRVREVLQSGWTCSFPAGVDDFGCYYEETFVSRAALIDNDFGNWFPATKSGMKFEDLNANGVKDPDELGLEGWTIYVDYDNDGAADLTEPSDVTNADGEYTITGINPGSWTVKEVGQTGWTCSFPVPCYYQETFTSRAALTGNDFGNWHPATKSGMKFEDLDADGVKDPTELGLAGWTIYVDVNGNGDFDTGEPSTVTGPDGAYTIEGITPGTHTVREVAQEDWTCSFPAPCYYSETFTSREVVTGNDFGNWHPATKSGMKFEDLDADGEKDQTEPGLADWTIFVDYSDNGIHDEGEPYDVTGADGSYTIAGINPGTWKVREVGQAGWTCSFPVASDDFGCYYDETFTSRAALTGNDFGNWHQATKSGVKFEDMNANGARGDDDTGLFGWTIYVDYDDDGILDAQEPSDVTDANGSYTITGIDPGLWKVREVGQANWVCSLPTAVDDFGCYYAETFTSRAELTGNDFGNWHPASKSGTKFEDLDVDGEPREAGEPGLEGWTIFVDYDDDGAVDVGEPSAVTGANGEYLITGINPGLWKVKELGQADWTCSFPAPCYYSETFTSREVVTGNDFGNWTTATKSGTKFEDLDADGAAREAGEPGLEGWTIFVDYNDDGLLDAEEPSGVTGPDGTYAITGIDPGSWKVKEVGQAGWTCSFPVPCFYEETFTSHAAFIGNDFGNWTTASKSGVKFEDLDADSVKDGDEPLLSGVMVCISDSNGYSACQNTVAGAYSFATLPPGHYTVCEFPPAADPIWQESFPNAATPGVGDCTGYPDAAPYGWDVVLESGDVDTGNDFGNWQTATKAGVKFEDIDADGEPREAGEPGLPGWTIFVDYDNDDALDPEEPSAVTDANGAYLIAGINPGTWRVKEVGQANWTCSFPAPCYYEETFTSGAEFRGNDFGNWHPATKSGMKFEDMNANGEKDADDPGVDGVTVKVFDLQGAEVASTVTAGGGLYSFSLTPGSYNVCEFPPEADPAWQQSFPNAETPGVADCTGFVGAASFGWAITLDSRQVDEDNDFGNWRAATKSGYKFNDFNKDGIWQSAGEPVISGWTITLLDALDQVVASMPSDANGKYFFGGLVPGVPYKVCETLQPGWTQSYPNATTSGAVACPTGYATYGWGITLHSAENDENNDFGNWQAPGCSLTWGYWKTHSIYGPAPYDDTWAVVGEDSPFYSSGFTWYSILQPPPKGGNAYLILAHQYIAAYLNRFNGANTGPVWSEMLQAASLLASYQPAYDWKKDPDGVRATFISLAGILDEYNNGGMGVPHCE